MIGCPKSPAFCCHDVLSISVFYRFAKTYKYFPQCFFFWTTIVRNWFPLQGSQKGWLLSSSLPLYLHLLYTLHLPSGPFIAKSPRGKALLLSVRRRSRISHLTHSSPARHTVVQVRPPTGLVVVRLLFRFLVGLDR